MKYKCKICKYKFRAKELNIFCPRCKRRGVVPYNDHLEGFFLLLAMVFLWGIITRWLPNRLLWFSIGFGILGSLILIELTLWIIRKASDPKFYIDELTGEVHYLT